ncbi:MAG TPA: ABC transporter substrate-binding protein [Vineibacter sp.]|nr:ABC transporter substrate-binding protein [Vineibacter sp.]
MRRRAILIALGGSAATWPLAARSQQKPVARIGFLATGDLGSHDQQLMFDAFRKGLRASGYVEGRTILIEPRGAKGDITRFPGLADELVRLGLDVIVATNSLAARAVQRATTTIPVVVPVMGDPVGDGLVASLARPGANVTGLTFLGPELLPKRLALLKEALPAASRVAALWHPGAYGERTMREMMKEAEAAAKALAVQLRLVETQGPDDLERSFALIAAERAEALIVYPSPMLFAERRRIVDLAARQRLPSMAMAREFVELGGLMSYGASLGDLHRRAAGYVDRILKGAKPADLPVEQATTFELAVNLKTAKELGLTIPVAILVRADEVIE